MNIVIFTVLVVFKGVCFCFGLGFFGFFFVLGKLVGFFVLGETREKKKPCSQAPTY